MLYRKIKEHLVAFLLPSLLLLVGCSASKTNRIRMYDKEWKKIVTSAEWENSLVASAHPKTSDTYSPYIVASDVEIGSENDLIGVEYDVIFRKKYHSFVLRAYFKIVTQAAKIDQHLKKKYEFVRMKYQSESMDTIQGEELALEKKKYEAHRKMLEGLRSWNIFNSNRTADLDFFKRDYIKKVYFLHKNGETEEAIIDFLIYRLADLYHYEDRVLPSNK